MAIGLAVAITVVFVAHARAWAFLCDDAFISFRYARNLAEHGALVFNVGIDPPERVEGYTNFLWVVVLAGLHRVGWAPPQAAAGLTQLGALAGLVAVTWLVATLRRGFGREDAEGAAGSGARLQAFDLLPAAWLVMVPEHMVWAHSGLETSWAGALTIGAMAAWTSGRLRTAGVLAAATALLRPDGLLPIAVFGITWLGVVAAPVLVRERGAAWERVPGLRLLQAALLFAIPLLVHLLWRRSFYGAWLPNTWAIKVHGALLRDTYGIAYVDAWLDAMPIAWVAVVGVMLRARHLLLVLPAAAVIGYGWWVGGDFMAYGRFYVVATGLSLALVGWLLADAVAALARLRARFAARVPAEVVPVLGVIAGVALAIGLGVRTQARWKADMAKTAGWLDGKWEGVATMDRFARVGVATGSWMREHLPPDTLITVGAAGAVPYAAGVHVIDGFGLVDPHVAHMPKLRPLKGPGARPGHQIVAPTSYIKQRDPDLLCHVGYRGPRRPGERRAHPAFSRRRGYTWACIDVPPVPDPRAEGGTLPASVYCCRRPIDRDVGPFSSRGGR